MRPRPSAAPASHPKPLLLSCGGSPREDVHRRIPRGQLFDQLEADRALMLRNSLRLLKGFWRLSKLSPERLPNCWQRDSLTGIHPPLST